MVCRWHPHSATRTRQSWFDAVFGWRQPQSHGPVPRGRCNLPGWMSSQNPGGCRLPTSSRSSSGKTGLRQQIRLLLVGGRGIEVIVDPGYGGVHGGRVSGSMPPAGPWMAFQPSCWTGEIDFWHGIYLETPVHPDAWLLPGCSSTPEGPAQQAGTSDFWRSEGRGDRSPSQRRGSVPDDFSVDITILAAEEGASERKLATHATSCFRMALCVMRTCRVGVPTRCPRLFVDSAIEGRSRSYGIE